MMMIFGHEYGDHGEENKYGVDDVYEYDVPASGIRRSLGRKLGV